MQQINVNNKVFEIEDTADIIGIISETKDNFHFTVKMEVLE